MFLLDIEILYRWTGEKFSLNLDLMDFYKTQAKSLNLSDPLANLKDEVSSFLREYVEEFDKDTELILAEIVELPLD